VHDWLDLTAFANPTQYYYGNSGRDILYSPGAVNFDQAGSITMLTTGMRVVQAGLKVVF
jgi:hypothetical protein